MLWYIIDGWNVIYKIPSIKDKSLPRQELIFFIRSKRLTGSGRNRVTVVFDGNAPLSHTLGDKQFEVVFSGSRSADDIIKKKAKEYSRNANVVVVTDDREIIQDIRSSGIRYSRVDDFLAKAKGNKILKQETKNISYTLQREITEELRKIWLKEQG